MKTPAVTTKPISDRLTRERTFDIPQSRGDGADVRAHVIFTIDQLLAEGFTGQIILNCNQGGVMNIRASQQERVPA